MVPRARAEAPFCIGVVEAMFRGLFFLRWVRRSRVFDGEKKRKEVLFIVSTLHVRWFRLFLVPRSVLVFFSSRGSISFVLVYSYSYISYSDHSFKLTTRVLREREKWRKK